RMTALAATASNTLLISSSDSRDISANRPPKPTFGARSAKSNNDEPTTAPNNVRRNTPRPGSVAKAWTEVSTPDRTRKAPNKETENVLMASSTVQFLKLPRFSVTAKEWINAVPINQGTNDEFSTGSQNHQPPQPSSKYAHQLPKAIPSVRNNHAAVAHGRDHRAHV